MATSRIFVPLLGTSVLALAGCFGPAPFNPTLPVVDRGATPAANAQPAKDAPDDALLALSRTGVEAAQALGPALKAFQPVLEAVRASRAKHPATYQLAQVSGWRFLGGAWVQADADGNRRLRAALETAAGTSPGWDVTDEGNYGPDFHPSFPEDAVRIRLDVDLALPSGRMAAAFIAPVGAAGEAIEATGTGSVASFGPAGTLGFEALNARIGVDGSVERGDLGLKGLGTGATLQLSGTWNQAGLVGATVMKSAAPAGTLVQAGGRWQFKNDAGSYPL